MKAGVLSTLREVLQLEGKKFDKGKIMFALIPPLAELEVAKVLTYGAQKYAPDNWRYVDNAASRYTSAARRHINMVMLGEELDEETQCHHYAHAICCLMFMLEMKLEENHEKGS